MTRAAFYDPETNTSYVSGLFPVDVMEAEEHFRGTSSLLDFMSRLSILDRLHPSDPILPGTRMTVLHNYPPKDNITVTIQKGFCFEDHCRKLIDVV